MYLFIFFYNFMKVLKIQIWQLNTVTKGIKENQACTFVLFLFS